MKVAFHLSTVRADIVRKALNNMSNIIEESQDTTVHCIVNTDGVTLLRKDSQFKEEIKKLADDGIKFKAFSNSIKNTAGMEKDEVMNEAEIVNSAVLELTKLQDQGFGYIRP